VFLYGPQTQLASVAILNMDDAGEIGPAAAMATLIFTASTICCVAYAIVTRLIVTRTQAWRTPVVL
jgi:iron(III) transport system permease protein